LPVERRTACGAQSAEIQRGQYGVSMAKDVL